MNNEKKPFSEDTLSALRKELGEIISTNEEMPGVYYIEAGQSTCISHGYYAVLDAAPIAAKVQHYGKKINGLRLFNCDEVSSGWQIVHYEVNKYCITAKKRSILEWRFRDMSLHAMEVHPEYFGMFPVPFHTPCGYTLLHRTLANGIYWLETSECKELLAVCFPIWSAELSPAAVTLCKLLRRDIRAGVEASTCYIFFSKEASCVPLYELMEARREWDGTVIDRPALMNAIWEFMPQYAMRLNGQTDVEFETIASRFWENSGIEPFPKPNSARMICMFPNAGTDFLLPR